MKMGYYLLSSETSFSAAHRLPGVEKCDRLHGHNWSVRLTVRVPEDALDEKGMGVDFRDIEETVQGSVADFDHAFLNENAAFSELLPTAENLARIITERTSSELRKRNPHVVVSEIEIWETSNYKVVYRP